MESIVKYATKKVDKPYKKSSIAFATRGTKNDKRSNDKKNWDINW